MGASTTPPIGLHFFSEETRQFMAAAVPGAVSSENRRAWFLQVGRYVLADTPGGRESFGVVDPGSWSWSTYCSPKIFHMAE